MRPRSSVTNLKNTGIEEETRKKASSSLFERRYAVASESLDLHRDPVRNEDRSVDSENVRDNQDIENMARCKEEMGSSIIPGWTSNRTNEITRKNVVDNADPQTENFGRDFREDCTVKSFPAFPVESPIRGNGCNWMLHE